MDNINWVGQSYVFHLVGESVVKFRQQFKLRPNAMKKLVAQVLEIRNESVELTSCLKIANGLEYGFEVFSEENNKQNSKIKRLINLYNSVSTHFDKNEKQSIFLQEIIKEWNLNKLEFKNKIDINITHITTYYETTNTDEAKQCKSDIKLLMKSDLFQTTFLKEKRVFLSMFKVNSYHFICIETDVENHAMNKTMTPADETDDDQSSHDGSSNNVSTTRRHAKHRSKHHKHRHRHKNAIKHKQNMERAAEIQKQKVKHLHKHKAHHKHKRKHKHSHKLDPNGTNKKKTHLKAGMSSQSISKTMSNDIDDHDHEPENQRNKTDIQTDNGDTTQSDHDGDLKNNGDYNDDTETDTTSSSSDGNTYDDNSGEAIVVKITSMKRQASSQSGLNGSNSDYESSHGTETHPIGVPKLCVNADSNQSYNKPIGSNIDPIRMPSISLQFRYSNMSNVSTMSEMSIITNNNNVHASNGSIQSKRHQLQDSGSGFTPPGRSANVIRNFNFGTIPGSPNNLQLIYEPDNKSEQNSGNITPSGEHVTPGGRDVPTLAQISSLSSGRSNNLNDISAMMGLFNQYGGFDDNENKEKENERKKMFMRHINQKVIEYAEYSDSDDSDDENKNEICGCICCWNKCDILSRKNQNDAPSQGEKTIEIIYTSNIEKQ